MSSLQTRSQLTKKSQDEVIPMNGPSTKRPAEEPLEKDKKRSAFGDLTNATGAKKAVLLLKKAEKKPAVRKTRSDSLKERKINVVPIGKKESQTLDQSTSSSQVGTENDSTLFISALDTSASIDSFAALKEELNKTLEFPPGVEDFDKSTLTDPFAEPFYAMDIFNYYKIRESKFKLDKYLDRQPDLSKGMRAILTDWLVEVQESFELNHETLYLAVKLIDHYLMRTKVSKASLQLLGATAVFVACKFDERCPPLIDDFLYICDDAYNRREMITMERQIVKALNFDLGIPLSYRFLRRFARCAKVSMEVLTLARFILETSLMEYDLVVELDSRVAAASLNLALKMKKIPEWTPTLEFYSGYKEDELMDLVFILNKMISAPLVKTLQTIRTKYSHKVFFEVAKIPPLPVQNL